MSIAYDFTFAELAIEYFTTGDNDFIKRIAALDATKHILNHAVHFGNNFVPTTSAHEFVEFLLTSIAGPAEKRHQILPKVTENLAYAKKNIAETAIAENIALQYLPKGFTFLGTLYFTCGYDIGVAFGNNCSLNIAHPIFLRDKTEMKYYAIHEIHHAGFIELSGTMPSLDIPDRKSMATLIEYLTFLEGMGTYAPLDLRLQDNATDADSDYVALCNPAVLNSLVCEYFDIYHYFADNPDKAITEDDWRKISILSDEKRLWYIVGAFMAWTIDKRLGRDFLTDLITQPPKRFITSYLG